MNNDNLNEKEKLDEKNEKVQTDGESGAKNFTLMFVALGCLIVGVIIFILSFFIKGAGVYLIITSMIFALACASFLNGQKRKAYSNACKVLQILSYVLMIACVAVVLAGTITVNTQK